MWESVALTLAGAAGNSIGKVIRGYALNRLWISGFLLDMCGAALMLTALSQAPVSVVQPIAGCGLAILCVFSHFYLKEVMNGLDWIAITMAGLGTIGVGVGGEEQKVEEIPLFSIPWLVLTVVILFVGMSSLLHMRLPTCVHHRDVLLSAHCSPDTLEMYFSVFLCALALIGMHMNLHMLAIAETFKADLISEPGKHQIVGIA
ncbi:putative magnesium transporter NIPA9 [Hordeum vulgare]|nr:putative magnesium transporter NIPA9 [Hordeum vulgare]